MEPSTTDVIVESLTRAIVEHRLLPGTKLAEQKLADHFGVSRTLVRQALFQLSQNRLIRLEPARGAFVATPSAEEARQVFAVRRMLETEMVRAFMAQKTPAMLRALKQQNPDAPSAIIRSPSTGEVIVDFVTWPPDRAFTEFNLFRYGKRDGGGVVAQQYALRHYGDATEFLRGLKAERTRLVELMAKEGLKGAR